MRKHPFLLAAILILGGAEMAQAHGGGLDRYGCHTNRKTGDYHCHRSSSTSSSRTSPPTGSGTTRRSFSTAQPTSTDTSKVVVMSRRELVKTAQILLTILGYESGSHDGILGLATTEAIKHFQEDHSLESTGKIDGNLLVRLSEEILKKQSELSPVRGR